MTRWFTAIALGIAALSSPQTWAQQAPALEPVVQATIDPPRVVVGQRTTLHIVVLAPNYMTSPPELPGFQVANAVTRQLQSVNTSEQRDGVSYAGVRFDYAISPQEAGSYAITGQSVRIKYAAEPPAAREVSVALPPVSFEAFVPTAAAALQPFVSADSLTVVQEIKRSSDALKAGDAVTRTVTIKATGTPAMLLPPQTFAAVDGLRLYPAQPALEDKTEGRTDVTTSTRVDSATYMLERPGNYALPVIDIGWWNNASGKVERIHLDAVPFAVAGNPANAGAAVAGRPGRGWSWAGIRDRILDHWLAVLLAAVVAAGLGLIAPRLIRRARRELGRRHEDHLRSEIFAFHRLCRAIGRDDAKRIYFALLNWLPRLNAAPEHTAGAFRAMAKDPVLDRQVDALETVLFADHRDQTAWSPHQMLRHVVAARRKLRPRARRSRSRGLPPHINPAGPSNAPTHGSRRPAR